MCSPLAHIVTWIMLMTTMCTVTSQFLRANYKESGPCHLSLASRNTIRCDNFTMNSSLANHIENLLQETANDSFTGLFISNANLTGNEFGKVFKNCRQITEINLSDVTSTTFNSNSFENCQNLEEISMDTVHINKYSKQKFLLTDLNRIKNIDIKQTQFSDLTILAQDSTNQLKTLTFEDSYVENIPLDFCLKFTKLQRLILSGNKITEVPVNCFNHMPHLNFLSLSSNPISTLQRFSLANVSLMSLELINCGIQNIEKHTFTGANHLSVVNLHDNELSHIPVESLRDMPNLQYLALEGNHINNLPAYAFQGLTNLKQINLNDCDLRTIHNKAFEGLPSIKTLYLGYNQHLRFDPDQRLTGVTHAKMFYFKGCHLKRVPRQLLPWYKIQSIYLNDNLWDCDCTLDWLPAMLRQRAKNLYTFTPDVECNTPLTLHKKNMISLSKANFTCKPLPDPVLLFREFEEVNHHSHTQMVHIVVPTTIAITLVILVTTVLVYRRRHLQRRRSQEETEQRHVLASTVI